MNYRNEVLRTAGSTDIVMGALGLAGESGEVVDLVKKHVYHGTELNRDKFIKELGDVRWYMEILCSYVDVTMEEVERLNIEKLKKRYPNGFTTQASIERKDVNGV